MQSKKHSIYEIFANQISGMIIGVIVMTLIFSTPIMLNITVSLVFMVISPIRMYIIRRIFNNIESKSNEF